MISRIYNNPWLSLITFFFTAFLLYFPTIATGFFSDDWHYLEQYQNIGWECFSTNCYDQFFLPLTHVIELVLYDIFGNNGTPYHLFSLTIHVLICFQLYKLFVDLKTGTAWAFLGALIFLSSPFHTETIVWVSSKSYLIASLLGLISVRHFLKGGNKNIIISAILFGLAAVTKEIVYTLPVALFAFQFMTSKSLKKSILPLIPFGIVLIAVLIGRYVVLGTLVGGYGDAHIVSIYTLFSHFGVYLLKFTTFYRYFIDLGVPQLAVISLSAIILISVSIITMRRKQVIVGSGFMVVLFFICLPVLALEITSIHNIQSDRYSYFPLIFFVIGLIFFAKQLKFFKGITIPILGFSLIFLTHTVQLYPIASEMRDNFFTNLEPHLDSNDTNIISCAPDNYKGIYLFREGLGEYYKIKGLIADEQQVQYIGAIDVQCLPIKIARGENKLTSENNKFYYIHRDQEGQGELSDSTLNLKPGMERIIHFDGSSFEVIQIDALE